MTAPATAAAWFVAVDEHLRDIDWEVDRADKVSAAHGRAVAERIRAALVYAVSGAETSVRADGTEIIDRDATLSNDVERRVAAILDQAVLEELIDIDEVLDKKAIKSAAALARSPLAEAHLGAFESAAEALRALGLPVPTPASAKKILEGVGEDARRNGRGIVERESRRAAEVIHRIVNSGAPAAEAEKAAAAHEIRSGDFARATVDHVRASARATLAWAGEQAGANRWLVALGAEEEKYLTEHAPTGQVSNLVWKTYTTEELDDLYRRQNADRASWSSWRDLGLTFGSPEIYVPLPLDAALAAAIAIEATVRRKRFEEARAARQADLDRLEAEREAEAEKATAASRAPHGKVIATRDFGGLVVKAVEMPDGTVAIGAVKGTVPPAIPKPPTPEERRALVEERRLHLDEQKAAKVVEVHAQKARQATALAVAAEAVRDGAVVERDTARALAAQELAAFDAGRRATLDAAAAVTAAVAGLQAGQAAQADRDAAIVRGLDAVAARLDAFGERLERGHAALARSQDEAATRAANTVTTLADAVRPLVGGLDLIRQAITRMDDALAALLAFARGPRTQTIAHGDGTTSTVTTEAGG